jgi:hypothetical protein
MLLQNRKHINKIVIKQTRNKNLILLLRQMELGPQCWNLGFNSVWLHVKFKVDEVALALEQRFLSSVQFFVPTNHHSNAPYSPPNGECNSPEQAVHQHPSSSSPHLLPSTWLVIESKLRGLSPQVNYTNWATTACWRSYCQHFVDRGCHMVSVTDP